LHLNEYIIKNSTYANSMDTVFHELRHQYQTDAIHDPDTFLVDDGSIDEWRANFDDYKTWEEDGEAAYMGQPVEVDARDLGEAAET